MTLPAFVAFQGGGSLGMAHVGAWQELARRFKVIGSAGTSAGAIVAALCAAGYDPTHALDLFYDLEWPEYVKRQGILELLRKRNAWSDGERFYQWLRERLAARLPGRPEHVTFASLYQFTGIYLAVVASDLNDRAARPVVFDKDSEPDTTVAFAVRASISIPGLFATVPRRDRRQELVDGGLLLNFPVELLYPAAQKKNCPLLGMRFDRPMAYLDAPNIRKVLARSFDIALTPGSLPNPKIVQDSKYIDIVIDVAGFSSLDFKLTRSQKDELVRRGANAASRALIEYELRMERSAPKTQAFKTVTGVEDRITQQSPASAPDAARNARPKYDIDARGATGVAVGDNAVVNQSFEGARSHPGLPALTLNQQERRTALEQQTPPHADILLVTVTDVEVRAVLDVLHAQFNRSFIRRHVGDKTYYDLGSIGGAAVAMVQSEMGAGGLGAALLTVQKGIDALKPVAVIMVGIAFGTDPKKQRIGDVLVARQLMPYEPQRLGQTKAGALELRARGDRSPASPGLLDKFRSGVLDWRPPTASSELRGAVIPKVHFGLVVSGEKLVDNQAFRDQLLRIEPDAIGGEMEGAGLYVAAYDRNVAWILVKAICDWADGNKGRNKKQRQRLAAKNAVEFVFHVLKLGGITQPPIVPQNRPPAHMIGNAPPLPKLMIGREDDVRQVKERLGIGVPAASAVHVLTAMRGWPGVGKTTLASALAYDPGIAMVFPDGVLWASVGQKPNLFAELAAWMRALGISDLAQARTIEEASVQLRTALRSRRMLLIVDDVWDARHAEPFRVGGPGCALLITTRLPDVAQAVAPAAGDVYVLGVLSSDKALELLQTLAPDVVREHPAVCQELVDDLEGLPLAIQVAGRLLQTEHSYGFSVVTLLNDIRAGAKLIEAQAPTDRTEIANGTTPTIAALLNKSTDLLSAHDLDCFAYLGVLAPKPVTFDAETMQAVWQVEDPKPTIRALVNHGLLEPTSNGRFWMHAILVTHARSLPTLREAHALREAHERHVNHFLHCAVSAAKDSRTLDETVMSALEADQGNFRGALEWLADNGEFTRGFSLAKALMTMWTRRGYDYDALGLIERLLAHSERMPPRIKVEAFLAAATLSITSTVAEGYAIKALELSRLNNDEPNIAASNSYLGLFYFGRAAFIQAEPCFREALKFYTSNNDKESVGRVKHNLGLLIMYHYSDLITSRDLQVAALQIFTKKQFIEGQGVCEHALGLIAIREGATSKAAQHLVSALRLFDREGYHVYIAMCLEAFADVALLQNDAGLACRLLASASMIRARVRRWLAAYEQPDVDRAKRVASQRLGPEGFRAEWLEGQAWTEEKAIEVCLGTWAAE